MDAGNAGVPADLENGGGGGAVAVTIEMEPCPADRGRGLKEKQLFTWLGELPYTVAVVVSVVLCTAGLVVTSIADREGNHYQGGQPHSVTTTEYWSLALVNGGLILGLIGLIAGAEVGWREREDLLRFEAD